MILLECDRRLPVRVSVMKQNVYSPPSTTSDEACQEMIQRVLDQHILLQTVKPTSIYVQEPHILQKLISFEVQLSHLWF